MGDGRSTRSVSDCAWIEQKSQKNLVILSDIYEEKLRDFFIHKIGISNEKTIYQIIQDIKKIDERTNNYYNLLVDLNNLVSESNAQRRYYEDIGDRNSVRDISQSLEKEKIFILDNNKKNSNEIFYFNDLNINTYQDKLKNKIFSVNNEYPVDYYKILIDTFKIKRLNDLEKNYSNGQFKEEYSIRDYRLLLNFGYDLLFTKFSDEYKRLSEKESILEELNSINKILIHADIISKISIDNTMIELNKVKYYIENEELYIVNKKSLFKIISERIGSISNRDLEHFFNNVIDGDIDKKEYYKEDEIKEKKDFPLIISDLIIEQDIPSPTVENTDIKSISNIDDNDESDKEKCETIEKDELSEEEKRNRREEDSEDDILAHNSNYDDLDEELNPDIIDSEQYAKDYNEKKQEKYNDDKDIKEESKKAEQKILNKINSSSNAKSIYNTKSKIIEDKDHQNVSIDNYKVNLQNTNMQKQRTIHIIKDEDIKDKLYSEYKGYCQICAFTFVKSGRKNSFEAFNWTDRRVTKNANRKIIFANSLSLCRNCAANIKFGQFKSLFLDQKKSITDFQTENIENLIKKLHNIVDENIPEKFQSLIEFDDIHGLAIELNNKKRNIYFTPKHYVEFITLMQEE